MTVISLSLTFTLHRKRQLQFLLEGRGRRAGLSPEELRDNGKLLGEGLSRALFNYPSRDCSAESPEVGTILCWWHWWFTGQQIQQHTECGSFVLLTGGQRGVIRAHHHGWWVPPWPSTKSFRHQSQGRGSPQALALHVCRDGERLCVRDEGPSSLPPSQPCKALQHQVKRPGGSHTSTHAYTLT